MAVYTVKFTPSGLPKERYPSLPLLLSLIDMALDRRELFVQNWDIEALAELRQQIELGIFDALEGNAR